MKIFDNEQKDALLSILEGVREDLDRQWLEKDELLSYHAKCMCEFEGKDEEKHQQFKELYFKVWQEREDINRKVNVINNFINRAELKKGE